MVRQNILGPSLFLSEIIVIIFCPPLRSYGGTVPTDIYALHGHGSIAGIVYFSPIPYIASIPVVLTPAAGTVLVQGIQDTDVTAYNAAFTNFVTTLLTADPHTLSFEEQTSWLGLGALIPQAVKAAVATRTQDPSRLLAEGGPVLPVLLVDAGEDALVIGTAVAALLRPHFAHFEVLSLPDSGHTSFLEKYTQVRDSVLRFVKNVKGY